MSVTFVEQFDNVLDLIRQAQQRALRAVNAELVDLYWRIGQYVSDKIAQAEWGDATVQELANHLRKKEPALRGFDRRNLYRMRQFYEAYKHDEFVSTVLTQIPWSHHLAIMSNSRDKKERLFYMQATIKEGYTFRELERQIKSGLYERTMLANKTLPSAIRALPQDVSGIFRDSYILEFLNVPDEPVYERDVQKGLIKQMKQFVMELGRDFLFVGEEFRLQVGMSDFYVDLLFFHRDLCCLIAIELKMGEFKPDYIGQINFYLEALDRDVRKAHENPSIGILLCKERDSEVVEYALSRSLSPTLVAEYQTKLPDKQLLQAKLHSFLENTTEL
ncbi:PDDEXK nuclease domain-containing protein [Spirosoma litoris]